MLIARNKKYTFSVDAACPAVRTCGRRYSHAGFYAILTSLQPNDKRLKCGLK
jgi:hypothetical protein